VPLVKRLALLVAAVGVTALGAQAATPGIPALYVDYQQNCTFTMSVDPGNVLPPSSTPTATLPPGTYQLLVTMPNPSEGYACAKPVFTLTGAGLSTRIEFPGEAYHVEPIVTLQPSSTYVAQEESAPAASRRTFATSASGSSSSLVKPSTAKTITTGSAQQDIVGSAIPRYRGKLTATISKAGKATLRLRGRAVGSLKAGRYDIAIDDEASRAGTFVQRGALRAVPLTGAAFVGHRTKRLVLKAGKWSFFARPCSKVSFTVVR
jgi:hypothetical protein